MYKLYFQHFQSKNMQSIYFLVYNCLCPKEDASIHFYKTASHAYEPLIRQIAVWRQTYVYYVLELLELGTYHKSNKSVQQPIRKCLRLIRRLEWQSLDVEMQGNDSIDLDQSSDVLAVCRGCPQQPNIIAMLHCSKVAKVHHVPQ